MTRIIPLMLISLWPQITLAIFWPVQPIDQPHRLGNYWGEYQNYGSPYLHPGIDIMGNPGDSVFAVRPGYVKAVLTTSGEWHWRVATGSSDGADSCNGWLYAHLEQSSIAVHEGDHVEQGQFLGRLVEWPGYDFHHCHFACIRDAGTRWHANWRFVGNPYDSLEIRDDTEPPVIRNAYGEYLFAINDPAHPSQYYNPGEPISGDIDIIARIDDLVGDPYWRLNPHRIEFSVHGEYDNFGPILSFDFSGALPPDNLMDIIYRADQVCPSKGDYEERDYYFVITNTDGDGVVENSDNAYSLHTAAFVDGQYWIVVTAYDGVGNSTSDSMQVTFLNGTQGVEEDGPQLPGDIALGTNYPNPFNSATVIPFKVSNGYSQLRIFDVYGREVFSTVLSGTGQYTWGGVSNNGSAVPTGIYFYRADGDLSGASHRMTLIK